MNEDTPRNGLRPRRLWIPLVAILLPLVLLLTRLVFVKLEFLPESWFYLQAVVPFFAMLSMLLIGAWFFFASRLYIWIRFFGVLVLVTLLAGAFMFIERVEFDGNLTPIVYLRGEKSPAQKAAEAREQNKSEQPLANLIYTPTDSPAFRGLSGDGLYFSKTKLHENWTEKPPVVKWKHDTDDGLGGIAVAGDSLVTIEQRGDQETVACLDRETGKERWAVGYAANFTQTANMGGGGPRTTPAIYNGRVYSLGATGELLCIDGGKGTKLWGNNVLKENNAENLRWGLSCSPLIIGSNVVVIAGSAGAVAYNLESGKKAWGPIGRRGAYASPMQATLGGEQWVIIFDAVGVCGLLPESGEVKWEYPWKSDMDMNSAQPVVVSPNRLFVSSELSNGGAALEIKKEGEKWTATKVWSSRVLAARYASPVFQNSCIFGLRGGTLVCVDVETGKSRWDGGSYGNGQVFFSDNKLVIVSEKGSIHLVKCDPENFEELAQFKVLKDRTWNMPALAGSKLYLRNHREIACVELP